MLDVAQVRTRDTKLASKRDLADLVPKSNRLQQTTECQRPPGSALEELQCG